MSSFIDINNLTFNNSKITIILDDKNEPWFKAKDIATVLEYNDTKKAYKHIDEDDKIILDNLLGAEMAPRQCYEKNTIYINKKGLETLLMKSKKIYEDDLINDMINKLDLNLNHIIKTKEQDSIGKIINVFKSLNYETQFQIGNYKIDLYFLDHKLAVECDEYGHSYYDIEKEIKRKNFIKEQLNCTFIRFNPDNKDFDIFNIIHKIFLFLYNNKST